MKRPALLTLSLLLLAAMFGWETRQALQADPLGQGEAATRRQDAWRPGASSSDPEPPPDPAPVAAAVAARPLFRLDRLPFREPAASSSPAPVRNYESELSRFALLGVLDFGDGLKAIVVSKAGTRTDRWELRAGDALPGFMVKEIRADGVLLIADGREVTLPLYAGPPTASGGALRTEVSHRDATRSAPTGTPPSTSAPHASPAASPQRAPATAAPTPPPAETSLPDLPQPTRSSPMGTPRFIPGRR